jgi:hypothetical protein
MTEKQFLTQLLHILSLTGVNAKKQAKEMIEERLNNKCKGKDA